MSGPLQSRSVAPRDSEGSSTEPDFSILISSTATVANSDTINDTLSESTKTERHLGISSSMSLMVNKMIGTGIFSIPSSIYLLVGSVGWSMVIWIIGGFIAFAGLNVYLEFGLEIPKSGSEKNYLERIYKRPRHLALCIFAITSLFLSSSTGNSYVFGVYLLLTFGIKDPSETLTRSIGVACITFTVILHIVFPRTGRALFNVLGYMKIVALAAITLSGLAVITGIMDIGPLPNNWESPFEYDELTGGGGIYNYSIALLRIFYSYRGWDSCNNVMGEVIDPSRTMMVAGPLAIGIVTLLYTFCNIAYFTVIPKQEIISSGVIIAGLYFQRVFGNSISSMVFPFVIAMSNLGNVLVVTYACGRVNRELGLHKLLPLSDTIATLKPFGTPTAGLLIHWVVTVTLLVIPPPGQIYEFVVDLSTYPLTLIHFSVTAGLLYLQYNHVKESWGTKPDGHHSPLPLSIVYLLSNLFLIVFPWVKPPVYPADKFPYWAVPATSVFIICILGPVYWFFWKKSSYRAKLDDEIVSGEYLVAS